MTNRSFVRALIVVGVQAAALSQAAPAVASTYLSATVSFFGGAKSYPNLPEPWGSEKFYFQPFSFTLGFMTRTAITFSTVTKSPATACEPGCRPQPILRTV